MSCIRYTEEDLFTFAFRNGNDKELLEILIKDFGLDVNWRKHNFYDTLLYQAFKIDLDLAKYLISKGACVNASLGGYPENENSHGYMSILDVVSGFRSLDGVGNEWLKQLGAISFENLPEDQKEKVIKAVDFTKQASDEKYLYRTAEQAKLSVMLAPEKVQEKLKGFLSCCEIVTVDEIQNKSKNGR